MATSLEYLSSGCNRSPGCVCWGRNGLVVFGSSSNVVVYSTKLKKVIQSLNGHRARVNCLEWVKEVPRGMARVESSVQLLVSGSADNTALVWRISHSEGLCNGRLVTRLEGHSCSVTALSGLAFTSDYNSQREILIATASADSSLRIWQQTSSDEFSAVQTLQFGHGFVLSVDLAVLTCGAVPFMVCGCDDSKLHCYVWHETNFTEVLTLDGHGDWIRGVDMTTTDEGSLMLASCSQDAVIRLWSITKRNKGEGNGEEKDLAKQAQMPELQTKQNIFAVNKPTCTVSYSIQLESVLLGHEDWIYSVCWHPPTYQGEICQQPVCLLSASMDKTMIIWKLDKSAGIWVDKVRVGDVGGNTLGFYGAVFSGDGKSILGHDYQGALHLWTMTGVSQQKMNELWERDVIISGHFGPVQSISWAPGNAGYLLSTSQDQTTRLHGPWRRDNEVTWHEVARPQIHGYDMQFIASLSSQQFVSAGDEKVIRVFEAPQSFCDSYFNICGQSFEHVVPAGKALSASVPALGLSNKAVYSDGLTQEPLLAEKESKPICAKLTLKKPPVEDNLLQNTLWPETQKLYGHGFEIFCLAVHPVNRLLASACRASKAEHAVIRLWDCDSWKQLQSLSAHSLTVTQMAFSNTGDRLLAVSRDRTWSVWRHIGTDEKGFILEQHADKKVAVHSRIIWTCSWSPDDKYFVTGSRDKKAIVWKEDGDSVNHWSPASDVLEAKDAVTAIDFCPRLMDPANGVYMLAIGLESGQVSVYSWQCGNSDQMCWHKLLDFNSSLSHAACVKQVQWHRPSPHSEESKDNNILLATCGDDHAVKIVKCIVDISLTSFKSV